MSLPDQWQVVLSSIEKSNEASGWDVFISIPIATGPPIRAIAQQLHFNLDQSHSSPNNNKKSNRSLS